jgi:hypothetical protein
VDEYQLEIQALRRKLAILRDQEADADLIEEHEAELRNLTALYTAASETYEAGEQDSRLRTALESLGFGAWTLASVYSFVYDASMEIDTEGRDLAALIDDTDFVQSLLAVVED